MKQKKTEVITIRTTASVRKVIETEAERREWTTSKMAEKILSLWAEQQENGKEVNITFQLSKTPLPISISTEKRRPGFHRIAPLFYFPEAIIMAACTPRAAPIVRWDQNSSGWQAVQRRNTSICSAGTPARKSHSRFSPARSTRHLLRS